MATIKKGAKTGAHGGNLKIEYRSVARLKPDPRNARTHSPAQIDKLVKLIKAYGWTNPILVDGKDGVVAGHGRLQAAKQMGMERVPVIELSGLTAAQRRAYIIADNRVAAESGWDPELLAAEFGGLKDMGFDLTLTGFDLSEITFALEPPGRAPVEPATPALPERAVSKAGDLWQLGEHRLLCGDSTKPAALTALMAGRQAAMVFTDPPYGVSYQDARGAFEVIKGDDLRRGQLANLLRGAFTNALAHSRDDAGWYVWHSSSTREVFESAIRDVGLVESANGYIIWVKPKTMGWTDYQSAFEPCFYLHKQGIRPAFHAKREETTIWRIAAVNDRGEQHLSIGSGVTLTLQEGQEIYVAGAPPKGKKVRHLHMAPGKPVLLERESAQQDVWEVGRETGHGREDAVHPNQKPTELARRAIGNSSREGEIVLDMFAGGGTTLLACEQTKRIGYALELDPRYVDVIVRRWETLTGKQATHAKEKTTFQAVAKARAKAKAGA